MAVLDELRALASDLEAGGRLSQFVGRDARHVEVGLTRAMAARADGDYLGAAMWKRLAVEAALRIVWLTGDDLVVGADGEPVSTGDIVRARCDSLRARDTLNLRSAYAAIVAQGGQPKQEILDLAEDLAGRQSANPAPKSLRDMAVNVPQRALYAQHRFCSSVLHPGAASGELEAQRLATQALDQIAILAVAFGRAVRDALSDN